MLGLAKARDIAGTLRIWYSVATPSSRRPFVVLLVGVGLGGFGVGLGLLRIGLGSVHM